MNTEFSLDMAQQNRVLEAIHDLINEAYDNSEEHGFHTAYEALLDSVPAEQKMSQRRTNVLAKLALIASEVGEAVREVQHGNNAAMADELADIIIRVLDLAGSEHIELGRVLLAKMKYNRGRPYMHGKQC